MRNKDYLKDIKDWNNELYQIANSIIERLNNISSTSSNEMVVELLNKDNKLLEVLNLDSPPIKDKCNLELKYNKWLVNVWGRKLKYYLTALQSGYLQYNQSVLNKNITADDDIMINKIIKNFKNYYTDQNGRDALSSSIKRRSDLNNNYHTYYRPTFIFSIIYLQNKNR